MKDVRRPSYRLTFEDAVNVWMRIWDGEFQNRIAAFYDVNPARVAEVLAETRQPGSRAEAMKRYRRSA
jgi:hypothetical protein